MLPPNTAFRITDINIPISVYTIEGGRNAQHYFLMTGSAYSASMAMLPEGTTPLRRSAVLCVMQRLLIINISHVLELTQGDSNHTQTLPIRSALESTQRTNSNK